MYRWLLAACLTACALARDPVRAKSAMVVTQEPNATDVGVKILKSGGNAIDAAVAIGFALAVTYPSAGNIGGGGFLLYRSKDGKSTFIDFRERAPLKASRDMYLGTNGEPTDESREGWRASGVPGTVAGLEFAHRKYGRKKWAELVAPAVAFASKGFELSYERTRSLRGVENRLSADPESKRIFLRDGKLYEPGEKLIQPELARTLKRILKKGAREFYEGETARILAEEMTRKGGLVTLEDLKEYKAVERQTLVGTYKGYEVITSPPPSSGGIGILQMFSILDGSGYEKSGWGAASTIQYVAETMRRAYADRAEFLGDPDFVKIPVAGLLSKSYLDARRASIIPGKATPSDALGAGRPAGYESPETTHFSIVDSEGNAVALTYTINASYGNSVTVPRLGFLLNNEMDDFSAKPGAANLYGAVGGFANAIAPKKTPLSSMTPTILVKDGKVALVIGAPGGTRIINGVFQTMLNVIDFKMNVQNAIDRPRFHHQWKPDRLYMESGFSPDTIELLKRMGYEIAPFSEGVASVQAIAVEEGKMGRWLAGGWDGRGTGKAAGY